MTSDVRTNHATSHHLDYISNSVLGLVLRINVLEKGLSKEVQGVASHEPKHRPNYKKNVAFGREHHLHFGPYLLIYIFLKHRLMDAVSYLFRYRLRCIIHYFSLISWLLHEES